MLFLALKKGLKGQIHYYSGFHYHINQIPQAKFSIPLHRGGSSPPPLFENPCSEECMDMHSVTVVVQSMQHDFPFKFSFWYINMS